MFRCVSRVPCTAVAASAAVRWYGAKVDKEQGPPHGNGIETYNMGEALAESARRVKMAAEASRALRDGTEHRLPSKETTWNTAKGWVQDGTEEAINLEKLYSRKHGGC
jgi:hypothetical protein